MSETLYIFHDKTGKCFDTFAKIDEYTAWVMTFVFEAKKPVIVGDMLSFRDDLIAAGFKWGIDFYVTKVQS